MRKVVDFVNAQKIFGKLFAQKTLGWQQCCKINTLKKLINGYFEWTLIDRTCNFEEGCWFCKSAKKYLSNCLWKKLGMITMLQKYLKWLISLGANLEFVCHCTWLFFLVWNIYFGTLKMQPISNLSFFSDYKWLKLVENQINHIMVYFPSFR